MRISDWSSDVCSSDLATARQILDLLPETSCLVFGLSPALLDALFRKARDTAALRDAELKKIHFHDSRREAATRLASKIDVMELARMGGWKNVNILYKTYYAPAIESIADKQIGRAHVRTPVTNAH